MKIGLLTLAPTANYGGILQAIALVHVLKELGNDVILINKQHNFPIWKNILITLLKHTPLQNIKNFRDIYLKSRQFQEFISSHIPNKSKKVISPKDLATLVKEEAIDVVLVGSDQVWRYSYINDGFYSVYFLDFKKTIGVKKISYAASFGTNSWEAPDKIDEVKLLLADFDAISVREKAGVNLCAKFGSKAELHLDPTLLPEKNFYEKLIKNQRKTIRKTLVTYILDSDRSKSNIVELALSLFAKNSIHLDKINLISSISGNSYSIEEWLCEIKNANYVITDSFHGMVFSILFSRQFIVFGNKSRGLSRFTDFLAELGLSNRLVTSSDMIELVLLKEIDYGPVQMKINEWRKVSLSYLKNNISQGS